MLTGFLTVPVLEASLGNGITIRYCHVLTVFMILRLYTLFNIHFKT